ncbi:hypothetical protein CEUSTIGMA_g12974.t1 [Chlamydomonas eustigma]|uniref:Uncharacterized protein n=1 Tax=Chlamydomonas eustigma TaxID=1157962 RepID=A0A250XRI8_9CHLO|nr:hypothetical protein CEUSTIGMA_g12974.t1 [Chlamydomonas eustigma]|eukprot:GAX85559.1 hypothetical protein CEUSTIGMA_g12974.t1 [Chlamydomonas eustigma]
MKKSSVVLLSFVTGLNLMGPIRFFITDEDSLRYTIERPQKMGGACCCPLEMTLRAAFVSEPAVVLSADYAVHNNAAAGARYIRDVDDADCWPCSRGSEGGLFSLVHEVSSEHLAMHLLPTFTTRSMSTHLATAA